MTISETRLRSVHSFVKREGRLSSRVQRVWDDISEQFVVTSKLHDLQMLAENGTFLNAIDFSERLFGIERANLPLVVEIGSGQGNQVVHAAANDIETGVDRNYLALEVYHTGAAHTLLLMRNAGVSNIRIAELDAAQLLLSGAMNQCIDELWTFFPDPWPKKRHHKRRLVSETFFDLVQNCLKSGGVWRLSTDWEDYAIQMQNVIKSEPCKRFEGRLLTNFEQKGIAAGRRIYDFCYQAF